jgi:tetratricopeptide (TPR) repeat protein
VTVAPLRRTVLALLGIVVSAGILRPQISDALVVRGDEFLYRADAARALDYYRRALAVDGDDGAAVDRFAFVATMVRDARVNAEALRETSAYLQRHPDDAIVRMDRAMAYRAAGIARGALADFALVGARTNDPRALTFAGYAAQRSGDAALARRLWRAALALQPGFVAAKRALERRQ